MLVRLRLLWADVILWLPVFALCTLLGAPLFVSVTVVSDVSPQAVCRRAYRERFCRTCLTGLTCPTRQCDTPAARLPRRRVAKQPKPGRTGSRSNIGVRYTSRSEPIKKSARDGCRVRTLLGVKGVKPLCGATEVKCLNDQKRSFSGGYEAARSLNAR